MGVFVFGEFGRNLASLSRQFAASADRPSNREECSLAFKTPDNTCYEQRGILGSALLEEEYVLRCLSARAITEAAQDQARHAPLPADLRHRRAFHLGRVGFELFAQRVLLRGRGHKRI